MRLNRRQMQILARYPRATRVWRRAGIRLDPRTRVAIQGNQVRVIRKGSSR